MTLYDDVLKIIWITRSFSTIVEKELIINRDLPRIYFYGRAFELINHLYGINSINLKEINEKGYFCSLEYNQLEIIIDKLIKLGFAQKSIDKKSLELLFPDNKFKIYNRLYQEKCFGDLIETEEYTLKIMDKLTSKLKSFDEIYDNFPNISTEFLEHILNFLKELKLIDEIVIDDTPYFLTPLKTYGDYEKYVKYCQAHSSDEVDLVGDLLDFCYKNKGIPFGLLPENLKSIGKICLDLGIIHGVNYEFGEFVGDSSYTLIFPTIEEFDMIKNKFNDFDKVHASIGLLIYGVYFNPHRITYPEKYIDALISREKLRGTSIHIEEKFKQFNPCIFSGIIDFSPGFSKYFTHHGELRTYKGVVPKLISSEDNREALRLAGKLFQNNEEFKIPSDKSKKSSIFEYNLCYADTAGVSTHHFIRKKTLKQLKIEEIYDIIRRR